MSLRKRKEIQIVPREVRAAVSPSPLIRLSAVLVLVFAGTNGFSAQALTNQLSVPLPVWTVSGPSGPMRAGQAFEVTATVRLPAGWYQDADSEFLKFEPTNARVVVRSSSEPATRAGKRSYTGSFTLNRTVVVDSPATQLTFQTGWQICQANGVCLLPAEASVNLAVSIQGRAFPDPTFWFSLLGALAGGLLLNLMPCVFPVLSLKALGLASAAGLTLAQRRRDALLFAAGGWCTLTFLGIATAAAAATGQRLDWGFTFQQPLFVWALTLAFWIFALQLWGVWSWRTSPFSVLMSSSAPRTWRSIAGGAFLVLAAVPCTAPLLGPALGFALTQPPALIPLFFAAAGAGLVAPLLILQLWPGWSRFLPRPGAWMVTVERLAGFVLAATVLYLLWIFTKQTSEAVVWPALAVLTVVALSLAAAGRWQRLIIQWMGRAVVAAAFAAALLWLPAPSPANASTGRTGWIPYSRDIIGTSLAAGQAVFVDATAAWCATCQVNEAVVLDRADVSAAFERLGVVRVRADYTRPDPAIRDWLESVGRAGLPVYALYRPGKPLHLFGELLSVGLGAELERLVNEE